MRLYDEYGDRAGFLFVYIREAHADDEWQLDSNNEEGVVFAQPLDFATRRDVAQTCSVALSLTMPCVVDDMNDTADNLYAAWPERLFVVGADDRIVYAGGQGPFGFDPEAVGSWLREHLGPRR